MITIDIPVSKAAKKFLTTKYGPQFIVSSNYPLGITILAVLNKSVQSIRQDYKIDKFPEVYQIYISEDQMSRDGCWLSVKDVKTLANYIEKDFREFVYTHTALTSSFRKSKYREILRHVLTSYNITEDDWNLASVIKDFDRAKEKEPLKSIISDKIRLIA